MRIDANPIQLLREVFRPLPPTAEIDAPEGDEKDSVLDAVVISDMARILAEQKDEAETAESKENEAAKLDEENSINFLDDEEESATPAVVGPSTPNSPQLTFESDSAEESTDSTLNNAAGQSEEAAQAVEEDTEPEPEPVAETQTVADEETETPLTISLEQSA